MIRDNFAKIQARIAASCAKAGRKEADIALVVVTKGRTIEEIQEALSLGVNHLGENRLQETLLKYKGLSTVDSRQSTINWHMVGHLQTNKAKEAVKIFDLIHSVDSLPLAEEINKQAARISKIQDILLEVKTSPEETKFGLKPEVLPQLVKTLVRLKNLNLKGLMTIAPQASCSEEARPYFRLLRELSVVLQKQKETVPILSMGMSDDFETAIEEGSTMLRIGRGIFA